MTATKGKWTAAKHPINHDDWWVLEHGVKDGFNDVRVIAQHLTEPEARDVAASRENAARVAKVDQFGPLVLECLEALGPGFQWNDSYNAALANMRAILEKN